MDWRLHQDHQDGEGLGGSVNSDIKHTGFVVVIKPEIKRLGRMPNGKRATIATGGIIVRSYAKKVDLWQPNKTWLSKIAESVVAA